MNRASIYFTYLVEYSQHLPQSSVLDIPTHMSCTVTQLICNGCRFLVPATQHKDIHFTVIYELYVYIKCDIEVLLNIEVAMWRDCGVYRFISIAVYISMLFSNGYFRLAYYVTLNLGLVFLNYSRIFKVYRKAESQ